MSGESDRRLLLLDPEDNVLVATARLRAGEAFLVEGTWVSLPNDLPLGHKIARVPIRALGKILKYGAPIGSATEDIARGAHVHVHNVKSDYTATYHLENERVASGSAA